jgi:uncharacterized protein
MKDKNQVKQEEIAIANTIVFVKKKLLNDFSGHDWWHIYRVWKMSLYLAIKENANSFVVQLAALLHDIDDWKLSEKTEPLNTNSAKDWLYSQKIEEKTVLHVCEIIGELSFKGAGVPTPMSSIEGEVVQDADRLDAIGAIGIARAFYYGGNRKREMYNPDIKPVMHQSFDEYKINQSTTINHFYEKLLLLKDMMNTDSAKKMAKKRHLFLEEYLQEFLSEWHGNK